LQAFLARIQRRMVVVCYQFSILMASIRDCLPVDPVNEGFVARLASGPDSVAGGLR
jgi:hypothetical protein